MPAPNEQEVLSALSAIVDPDLGRDVVSLGMIKDLSITGAGAVAFTFELTTPACPVRDRFKSQAEELVGALDGVSGVSVKMTANVRPGFIRQASESLPGVRQNMKAETGMTPAAIRERSSILRMDQLRCPVLILHGQADQNVPVSQALLLRERLIALHKEFELENNYLWGGAFVSATT